MEEYVRGRIIVGFKPDVPLGEVEKTVRDFGLSIRNKIGSRNTYLIIVPVGSEQEWIGVFEKLTSVRFAKLNGVVSLDLPTHQML